MTKRPFHTDFFEIGEGLPFCTFFRDESLKSNDFRAFYYLQIHKIMIYYLCISVGRAYYTYFQVSMYYIIEIMLLSVFPTAFLFSADEFHPFHLSAVFVSR